MSTIGGQTVSPAEHQLSRIRAARRKVTDAEAALETATKAQVAARKVFQDATGELRTVLDEQIAPALPFGR